MCSNDLWKLIFRVKKTNRNTKGEYVSGIMELPFPPKKEFLLELRLM
jgi:hypothetical protein